MAAREPLQASPRGLRGLGRGGRRLCAAGVASLVMLGAGISAPVGAVAAGGTRALYVREVLPLATAVTLGATDPGTDIGIGVMLTHPDQAAEDRYIKDEYTPGTAAYRHWLSAPEYQARFGVSPQALAKVVAWLASGGLRVVTIPNTTDYVLAAGPASAVGRLLDVSFNQYRLAGTVIRANDRPPSAPAALGIFGFSGLDTLQAPHLNRYSPASHPQNAAVAGVVARPNLAPAGPRPALVSPTSNLGLSTPQVLWDVYQQPPSNKGEGQTMAIFGWGVTDGTERDLRIEEKEFKLPGTAFSAAHYGTEPVTDRGGLGEWDLDTQASSGMAPNTQGIKLYFGNAGTDPDLIGAYSAWVNDAAGPLQGNSSFSGCEEAPGTDTFAAGGPGNPQGVIIISNTNQDLYDATLKHAVAEGRTMFASTGDLGSSCPWLAPAALNGITNEAVPLLNYPADSAYAVGVGGTILYYDGDGKTTPATRALEYAWTYTGGGSSFFMKAGDYQSGVTTIVGHCVTDPHGNPYSPAAPLCRGIPDITAQSGDFQFGTGANPNGYTIASGGSPDQPGGGTSLSSPLWMGMWTRVQAASAGGTGFANPALYTIGKDSTKVANDFFDITQGSNGYYPAAPGWDYVSGWGAPMLTNIMKDVNGGNVTPIHNTPPPAVVTTVPTLPIHNNPCDHLFTGKAGNDSLNVPLVGGTPVEQGSNPQLNILAGDMTLSSDGLYLITTLTINNLTKALPPGGTANQYYMNWVFKGVTYYSVVEVSQTGVVTFGDGQITTGRATRSTTDGGQFIEGPNGKVIVDVPLSAVGNIVKGDQLSGPYGTTQEVEGVILPSYDQAGPNYDYQVGQVCTAGATTTAVSSPTPAAAAPSPTPTAAPLPNTALAAAGIWLPLGLLLLTLLGGVPLALLRRRGAG